MRAGTSAFWTDVHTAARPQGVVRVPVGRSGGRPRGLSLGPFSAGDDKIGVGSRGFARANQRSARIRRLRGPDAVERGGCAGHGPLATAQSPKQSKPTQAKTPARRRHRLTRASSAWVTTSTAILLLAYSSPSSCTTPRASRSTGCSVGNVRSAGAAADLRPEARRQRLPQRRCEGWRGWCGRGGA